MTGEKSLVKKDTRLFLFQALKRGAFEGPFIAKMKKDCAGMSFQFAKKYYELTYEAYLRLASACVLGIINFGLIRLSGNNLEKAAEILKTESPVNLFKAGWLELAGLAKSIYDLPTARGKYGKGETLPDKEKYLAETVSAEPQTEWIGLSEYQKILKEIGEEIEQYEFRKFFVNKYAAQTPINLEKRTDERVKIRTSLFSLLISKNPHSPLKRKEIPKLLGKIIEEEIEEKFKSILFSFATKIPAKYRKSYQQEIIWLLEEDKALPDFLERFRAEGSSSLQQLFYSWFEIEEFLDQISKDRYLGAKEALRGQEPAAIVTDLPNLTDASDRLAAIDAIAHRAYQLDSTNLVAFLEEAPNEWQGKIDWTELPSNVFVEMMLGEEKNAIVQDICQQKLQEKMVDKFAELPLNLLVELYDEVKECRQFLLEHIRIPADVFKERWKFKEHWKFDVSILFLAPNEWEDAWIDLLWKKTIAKKVFKAIKREAKKAGFNQQEIYNLLLDRAYQVAYLYKSGEMLEDDAPPFYCQALKAALRLVLSSAEFAEIKEDLAKLLRQRKKKK